MPRLLPTVGSIRGLAIGGYVFAALLVLGFLVLAAFPIGILRTAVERRLSDRFARPVTIGSIERRERFSLTPTITIQRVRVPQARWAGTGDLAAIERVTLRLPLLPLLHGRFEPRAVDVTGAHVVLVRGADGRENWHGQRADTKSRHTPVITQLRIADSTIVYRDAKQDRAFTLSLTSDAAHGVQATGSGVVRGAPVAVSVVAPAVERAAGRPWPFRARITGGALALDAKGTMAAPLDTDRMTLDVTARADDLKRLDAIIEVGLFGTQPVRLTAHVEHDAPRWHVTHLTGTIGRSRIAGHADVDKHEGRTKLDGAIVATQLDFGDLMSDSGKVEAAAEQRAIGPRLVPDTRINLAKIRHTDGVFQFRIDRIINAEGSSSMTRARGTLTLDDQRLTVSPLTIGLRQGAIGGRAVIDQRGEVPVPRVTLDLRLTGSSIAALTGAGGPVTGQVAARVRLAGRGSTIREAVGHADGRIGVAARNGSLPARIADALGFDVGRAVLAGGTQRASLRCVIVGLGVRHGLGRTDLFVLDTSQSRMTGTGTVRFPDEALAIRLTGAPKQGEVLRLPGSATLAGTIRQPVITVPREVKSAGNIFKAIGRAITGHQGLTATDADCAGLAERVLR